MQLKSYLWFAALVLTTTALFGRAANPREPLKDFARGADVSELQMLEDHGAVYRIDGAVTDPLEIFRRSGFNWMRLRLFVHPNGVGPECNDLTYTLQLAKRIKSKGFKLLLDLHYSDTWADPSKQHPPTQWLHLSHPQLVARVRDYTRDTIESFRRQQALPDMVEIGNEITNGMLWDDGRVSPKSNDPQAWSRLGDLLNAGISGIDQAAMPGLRPLLMIHIDRGGDRISSEAFYDHLQSRQISFDVIGLSDYPWWQGGLEDLRANLDLLAMRYRKPIIVVETSFPWMQQIFPQGKRLVTGDQAEKMILHFPATPAGQANYLRQLIETVRSTPESLGAGVFYWAAAWVHTPGWGAPSWSLDWEQRALFDRQGNALPALAVLGSCCESRHGILRRKPIYR